MATVFIIFCSVIVTIIYCIMRHYFRKITIYEYQRGLKYVEGKFAEVLEPGQYWIYTGTTTITPVDIRPSFVSITGQEVLSSDGVTLKVSLAAKYEIKAPHIAVNKIQNYHEALYLELQLALREIIGTEQIDELLEKRKIIGEKLMELTSKKVEDMGLKLLSVDLKDIMFPGELKKVFSQVVKAKKEGLAALEKARGETAALRNLANAAKMLENNPSLMQLRLIQALGESSGNTLILGMPSTGTVVPIKGKEGEIKSIEENQK